MFKKIIETIVGGAIGIVALYVVAKVAYDAGYKAAEVERRCDERFGQGSDSNATEEETEYIEEEVSKSETKPTKRQSKLGLLFALKKFVGKGNQSVISDLVSDPEDHKLEAYIKEGEVHINIKKQASLRPRQALKGVPA